MRIEEAAELYRLITICKLPAGSTILNIGSSTGDFRERVQPHIFERLFLPLACDGYKVIHCDIKSNVGVDLVGDVLDENFQNELTKLSPALVLCSNLLEHLIDRTAFVSALKRIVPASQYLLISVPNSYPYHGDPIDTLFRPTPDELAFEFLPWTPVKLGIIESDSYWGDLAKTGRPMRLLLRHLLSIMLAIRSPKMFFRRADRLRWLFRKYTVSVALLQG
ncbi:hypothetical protein MCEREM21A_01533 [Sphingomonadaceae bacterium]